VAALEPLDRGALLEKVAAALRAHAEELALPFGGYKQSGIGREESIKELYTFTQTKNIHITL
jgi:acyl-CoA reductase-like NAD-dependent aldehyde dehydrogenase